MSRKLKFRAWSNVDKCFITDRTLFMPVGGSEPLDGMTLIPENDYVIQQFTGMVDKNGKEIYEGDVINFAYTHDNTFTGDVKWFDDRGAFGVVTGNAFELLEGLLDYWEYVEVIGNIFEYSEDENL